MTDPLPPELDFAGNLWASSGTPSYTNGTVSWNGAVGQSVDVEIRFDATVDAGIFFPTVIHNTASIADGAGHNWQKQADVYILTTPSFLPMVER